MRIDRHPRRLHAGLSRWGLVSPMTREAADEMALEPGDLGVAVVKAATVMVEVPPA